MLERTFYQPAQGATAATVAQGYDNNFQALREEVEAGDAATLQSSNRYTASAVSALLDSAPAALDTLRKTAAALGDDPHFSATVMQQLGERVTAEALDAALAGKADTNHSHSLLYSRYDIGTVSPAEIPEEYFQGRFAQNDTDDFSYIIDMPGRGAAKGVSQLIGNASDTPGLWYRHGTRTTGWGPLCAIWHSGNDGAGSGLDADLWHGMQLWRGTQAQYDAIPAKDPDTLYIVTE